MDSINNNNQKMNVARYTTAGVVTGAIGGAAVAGVGEYIAQRKILQKPDEFIKTITGEVEHKRMFNIASFKGTQEAADLANAQLDKYLKEMTEFAKGGKYKWDKIFKLAAKNAGLGALLIGCGFAIAGMVINALPSAVKNTSKLIAEGVNEANAKQQ